jgi:adenylyltransferase/sulfurtransferase
MNNEKLSKHELQRYSRHINLNEIGVDGQIKLKNSKVLIVGIGGLGSPAALYLAAAGIGTLGIMDYDTVSLDNLQRQILFSTEDIGKFKVHAAKSRLANINPKISIIAYQDRLTSANAFDIIQEYDVILDCTDNFPTRYLVNDACILNLKPYVYGSIYKFDGQVSVFGVKGSACYRCLYPEPPEQDLIPNCAEGGVLGVLPGIIGTLQATEAIKLLLNIGEPLVGRMFVFNALEMKSRVIIVKKDEKCKLCGEKPEIHELVDYELNCESSSMKEETEITVIELREIIDKQPDLQLIDVREDNEFAEGKIEKAKLIPLGQIVGRMSEIDDAKTAYILCRAGKRSATAIQQLKNAGYQGKLVNIIGGMLAWSAKIDPTISVH